MVALGAMAHWYTFYDKYFYIDLVCKNKKQSGELVSFGDRYL